MSTYIGTVGVGLGTIKYDTLQSIVEQLEKCEFQTKDGLHTIETNTAFIALKERAEVEKQQSASDENGTMREIVKDKKTEELREAVFTALGEASMCWENILNVSSLGTFDACSCREIGNRLISKINDTFEASKRADIDAVCDFVESDSARGFWGEILSGNRTAQAYWEGYHAAADKTRVITHLLRKRW
jgi:hypothetical protein